MTLQMIGEAAAEDLTETLLLVLLIISAIAAVAFLVATIGCVFAFRAGRGSRLALGAWIVVAALELVVQALAVPAVGKGTSSLILFFPGAALVAQVALYLTARMRPRPPPPEADPRPQAAESPPRPRAW